MNFDNIVEKAKDGFDIVCKKAEETAVISKLRFEIASLETKRKKDYEMLGRLLYKAELDGNVIDEEKKNVVIDEISLKTAQIAKLREEIETIRGERYE